MSSLTPFLTSNYNGLSNNRVPQLLKPNTFIKHKNKWVLNVLQNKYIYYFFNKSHFVFDIKNTCTDIFLVSDIWYEQHYTVVWFWPWYQPLCFIDLGKYHSLSWYLGLSLKTTVWYSIIHICIMCMYRYMYSKSRSHWKWNTNFQKKS